MKNSQREEIRTSPTSAQHPLSRQEVAHRGGADALGKNTGRPVLLRRRGPDRGPPIRNHETAGAPPPPGDRLATMRRAPFLH